MPTKEIYISGRKNFILSLLLFTLIFANSQGQPDVRIKSLPEKEEIKLQSPAWLDKEPLIVVGNWDSAPIFRIRKGGNPLWSESEYERAHSEEAVQKLKDLGVTMAIIHFYKGYGLEAEKDQMEDAKKLAALLKKHGIRVGVYIGSTVAYETMLVENPSAEEWLAPDYLGEPPRYGGTQTFRKSPYFMHPGFVEYMKSVVRIAIEDLDADLIHFDNTSSQARRSVMHHPLAKQHFKEYLQTKYTPEQRKARLGFSDVSYVEPPIYEQPIETIDDPLFQMWTDFRCHQLSQFYREMAIFIKGLDSTVAVENNPSGLSGTNLPWQSGVDHARLLRNTDIFWDESGNEANITQEGILLSRIRTYKMGRIMGNKIFTYTSDSKLQMAEAMAYNRQCLGMIGGMLAGYELTETRDKYKFDNPYTWGGELEGFELTADKVGYIKFYRDSFKFYKDIETISDVAVLHSFPSLAFNSGRPYQSTYLIEQSLIQSHIPFDIIFDQHLNAEDLAKYKVLILPNQEALSDAQLEIIRKFVDQGGGLVATEHTSLYTETRRRRSDFGLADLFMVNPPLWQARAGTEKIPDGNTVRNSYGAGRVVYIPEIIPELPKPPAASMSSAYWYLPKNHNEIISSVKHAAGSNLSIQLKAPKTVTMELVNQKSAGLTILHLINYNVKMQPEINNIGVKLFIPQGKGVKSVKLTSPDRLEGNNLQFKRMEQFVEFTVPILETYDVIVVETTEN